MTDYPLDKIMKHKRTMLLLDRVVSHTDNIVVAEVTISPASTFFHDGHVPAWVGLEYAAQAVAAFSGIRAMENNGESKVGFLLSCRRYICSRSAFKYGDVITIHAQEEFNDGNMGGYTCSLSIGGEEVASVTLSAYIPEKLNEMTGIQ
tara:strand:- start:933 stop:1376 length:444 start_codon:yes stop_codon:yes gene_type:complete